MTKKRVHLDEVLSPKTYNICSNNEIYNFQDLKEYLFYNSFFKNLRNSDGITNNELVELCLKNSIDSDKNKIMIMKQNKEDNSNIENIISKIIHLDEVLSKKAYEICSNNEIYNFKELQECFLQHGSFKHFRKCGLKTNNELIGLCVKNTADSLVKKIVKLKPKENKRSSGKMKNFDIVHLDEKLSKEACDICTDNEAYNFTDLKQQYIFYGSFRHFRNSFDSINDELIKLCITHDIKTAKYNHKIIKINEILIQKKIDTLTSSQVNKINHFINAETLGLSVNCQKVLNRYLKNELDLIGFTKHIFSREVLELTKIKSIAKKSIPELGFFIKNLIEYILNVSIIEEEVIEINFDK